MIKKQTVWLLTMISLLVVLSIYYVMSDKDNFAFTFVPDMTNNLEEEGEESSLDIDVTEEGLIHESEFFTTTRMEIEDKRSMKKERLKEVISANNVSAEEVNEALDEIDYLENITMKEKIARQSILSLDDGYEDVLIRTEDEKAKVHVMTEEMSPDAAVHIIQVVRDEVGVAEVEVDFQMADEK